MFPSLPAPLRASSRPYPIEPLGARRRRSHWWLAVAAGLGLTLSSAAVRAQEEDLVAACLDNHTQGQELRQSSKLLESREAFRLCSAAHCPNQIIRDCGEWLEQVQRQIPSISFRVTADGASRADAEVFIDGQPVLERLSGKALDLNPGIHRLRVVLPPFEPYEADLVLSDGEKFRIVEVAFKTPPPPEPVRTPTSPPPTPELHRPVPVTTYVFAGLTAAAAISGAGWALSSWSLRRDMDTTCSPQCPDEGVEVLKQRALLADISWGVGAASLITAVTFYMLRPEVPVEPSAVGVDVSILPSGGALGTVSFAGF